MGGRQTLVRTHNTNEFSSSFLFLLSSGFYCFLSQQINISMRYIEYLVCAFHLLLLSELSEFHKGIFDAADAHSALHCSLPPPRQYTHTHFGSINSYAGNVWVCCMLCACVVFFPFNQYHSNTLVHNMNSVYLAWNWFVQWRSTAAAVGPQWIWNEWDAAHSILIEWPHLIELFCSGTQLHPRVVGTLY